MRYYECTVIFAPELSKQQVGEAQSELGAIVEGLGGQTSKHEYWGLRATAYPIEKFTRAHYVYFNITAAPAAIIELERKMKIREDILRYLTVRLDALDEEPTPMMQAKLRDDARKESRSEQNNDKNNNHKESQNKDNANAEKSDQKTA